MDEEGSRRRFLKSVGALGAAIPAAAAAQHAGHASAKSEKYMFLAPAEVAFLDAAVARLIPGPSSSAGMSRATARSKRASPTSSTSSSSAATA